MGSCGSKPSKPIPAAATATVAENTIALAKKDFTVPVSRLDSRANLISQPPQPAPPQPEEEQPVVKVPRPKDSNPKLSKAELVKVESNFDKHYLLGKMLGKGNYSVVHEATRRALPSQQSPLAVAVKMVNKRGLDASDIIDIKEEVSILKDLDDHGHIIQLFGLYEDVKFYYIVTEIMAGGELFEEIVEREFYWERDAQEVVKMLADAIGYMHSKGLVHRDLKPENVLLTSKGKEGKVKLADFGFAARTDQIETYPLNCACGTPGYVAPEIVSGLHYGREVDMWSLGVIAFILLGGYPPFHDEDQQELFRMIRRGRYSFDPAFWGLVSEDAKSCVRGLLCVDRTKRLKAQSVLQHPWLASVTDLVETTMTIEGVEEVLPPANAKTTMLLGGVGGRGAGLEGRGQGESINLTPALRELRKFQARQRWKDGMAMALAREGQVFGIDLIQQQRREEQPVVYARMTDISLLTGLGSSAVLNRLQAEKRQRNALNAHF
ncbi:hypothetical protein BASA81_006777 [Batrachochytrium salamandrivorans]|nr:hypothetical protein BASA81_006777 [Batrachochytrium salamandrivorans]